MSEEQQKPIVVRNLVKKFGDQVVLDDLNFYVNKGEILVIMGGSGCGKSTLLRSTKRSWTLFARRPVSSSSRARSSTR